MITFYTFLSNYYILCLCFLAYVRLYTNVGPLNLELHSDMVPKTCENFLKHCENGYYTGTKFHRSIRNFMVGTFYSLVKIYFSSVQFIFTSCSQS